MTFKAPIPVFRIFDETKAKEFYLEFLGFTLDWAHRFEPESPLFMQVSRGECRLNLSEHYGDACPGSTVRIETDEVEAYQQALLAKHYKYYRPGIMDTEWKTREMSVQDPFGNRLTFYKPLTSP